MARKRKVNARNIFSGGLIALFLFGWLIDKLSMLTWPIIIILISAVVLIFFVYFLDQRQKFRAIQISNIDSMKGIDFERYLQNLLRTQGYNVNMTQASGDLGVDLVASRGDENIAIQVKRCNTKISRRAISDAVAGMQHYRCTNAMVITNNYFTPGAMALASSTGCILVDRDTLVRWIMDFQNGSNGILR